MALPPATCNSPAQELGFHKSPKKKKKKEKVNCSFGTHRASFNKAQKKNIQHSPVIYWVNKCPQHCIAKELNITVCINLFSLKFEQLEQKQLPLCEGCCLIALHIIIYPRHHRGKDNKAKGSPLNSVSTKHLMSDIHYLLLHISTVTATPSLYIRI